MKLSSKYLILFFLVFKLSSYSNDNLDSLFVVAKNLFLEQFRVNNLNDKEGRSSENKYVIVIEGNSVHFQNSSYINNANQYLVESGDGGNILSTTELSTTQNNLANFHTRRIGKEVKVKFYTVVVNNFRFYFNKNISTIDTGAVNISKLGEYIRNEKLQNLNKETKKKIVKFQTDILNEVSSLNNADSSSNFILYTYCRLSAVDALSGQTQTKTYYRDYLGFYGAGLTNYARYIRKESSVGINTIPNQRITKIIDNVINAVEVYIDGGFVPLDANYCGNSFASILNDTKANRKHLFTKEAESFKSFINGNTKTNTIHYDKEVTFNSQNTTFINDVLKERLSALTGNSSYKVTFYFKEIPFVIDNDSLKLFATKCVEGSSLDGNNNIVIVVPYFAQKCAGDLYFFNFGSYKGIPMPVVYCSNATVKNGIETVLFGNGDLNTRLNNLFIHVPKKQHYIFGLINYEGNLIVKTFTTQTETTGEPNVYTFKLLEDKRCKTLVSNIVLCQGAAGSLGYTTTAGGAVNTSSGVYVTTTDFTCLKPKNNATMAGLANWQMIVHGLKESAAKSMSTVMAYIQWYTHDYLIGQLIEYIPPSSDYFIGGKNEIHYQNVLSVLDAVSTALAPTGLDAFFDAGTAVYCLTQGETSDALLYSVAFMVPVASGGMVKGAVEGTHYFYIAAKDGKLKIPSLGTSCPMGGVGFDVSKKVNKKIYSTIANTTSYNRLLNLKNDPEYVGFIIHIDDAVDNAQLAQRFKENPQAIDDYFSYYKENKGSKSDAQILNGFLENVVNLSWIDDLVDILPVGAKNRITEWINEGINGAKLKNSFSTAPDKTLLFNKLNGSKGINHRKAIIEDYLTIPGVTEGAFISNSVDNILSNVTKSIDEKSFTMYPGQARTFAKNATLSSKSSIEIIEDLGNGIKFIKVKPGTKLYRVFDGYKPWDDISMTGNTLPNGSFWTFDKPSIISEVIEGTAVMPEWNGMSKIIEIEVPATGLYGWFGKAAKQPASSTTVNFYLKGEEEQIIISFSQNQKSVSSIATSITIAPWIK